MRLSATQKDVLFLLYGIEVAGRTKPVPGLQLLRMINGTREKQVFASNFRAGCHTLNRNGLIEQYRNHSLNLAFMLTEKGRVAAKPIYEERKKKASEG